MVIAVAMCVIWYIISNFNISISGRLSNIFFYSMVGISICIIILFFTSGKWSVDNLLGQGGSFTKGGYGLFVASGVLTI